MDINVTPFQTRITHFQLLGEPCRLPFVVGSATQHRPSAVVECHSSQDGARLIVSKNHIVAVVTDGCSSTHPQLEASCHSSNEVGSKLLAYLISNAALKIATSQPKLSDRVFLKKLNDKVRGTLKTVLRTFSGTNRAMREMFAFDFLMSTVIGFIVTEARFLVFHSGDGIVSVNGEISNLDDHAGEYIANDLIRRSRTGHELLKACNSGNTSDLQSIFLATDGFSRFVKDHPAELRDFAAAAPPANQIDNGFDFLLQEFRRRIGWNSDLGLTLDDDATFVLLRRVRTECC